jgi:hypothetical protein
MASIRLARFGIDITYRPNRATGPPVRSADEVNMMSNDERPLKPRGIVERKRKEAFLDLILGDVLGCACCVRRIGGELLTRSGEPVSTRVAERKLDPAESSGPTWRPRPLVPSRSMIPILWNQRVMRRGHNTQPG